MLIILLHKNLLCSFIIHFHLLNLLFHRFLEIFNNFLIILSFDYLLRKVSLYLIHFPFFFINNFLLITLEAKQRFPQIQCKYVFNYIWTLLALTYLITILLLQTDLLSFDSLRSKLIVVLFSFNFLLVSKKLDYILNLVISDAVLLNALNWFVAKRTLVLLIVHFLQAL